MFKFLTCVLPTLQIFHTFPHVVHVHFSPNGDFGLPVSTA
ncbi:hypothetical protein OP10G_1787 [Fimbriimonas ginsengisoli Gsoil 348]|uniref:Uncharacterized protein n=1 Tax=Fimbriimonas ginsengisoli Gsoil 348 TaxID=661478 RepID=A0A068NQY6_FIMGI|nr:hypothetical protein OP10G_1787 [Fimbriimonas ginsengisoli Gsoil 348]